MPQFQKLAIALIALTLLPTLANASFFDDDDNDTTAKISIKNVNILHDFPYGPDKNQTFDVYIPPNVKNAPVIFMVHGGGWRRGDKSNSGVVTNKANYWLPKGYIFISVNYPMIPDANPVQQRDNIAKALATAQANTTSWGGNTNKYILMGHSAGAHLVALLNADPTKIAAAGAWPVLGTVALDSAAMDVPVIMQNRHFGLYDKAFGKDRNFWEAASPIYQLKPGASPMLMVCSSRRDDSCRQANNFAAAAANVGIKAIVLPQDLSHGEINKTLGEGSEYTAEVDRFITSLIPKPPLQQPPLR